MILGKHIGSIRIIWTVFGIYDIPTQLWVSRDLDKQGNLQTRKIRENIHDKHDHVIAIG